MCARPAEQFDARINDLLARVTGNATTAAKAEALVDDVFDDPLTLTGVMNDSAPLASIRGT